MKQKYKRGNYSHDTALYLFGFSDHTPIQYTMAFPKGYDTPNTIIKRVIPEYYSQT